MMVRSDVPLQYIYFFVQDFRMIKINVVAYITITNYIHSSIPNGLSIVVEFFLVARVIDS